MHKPVMLKEVLEHISPKDGEVYVDGTFGAGGYTRALLESSDCKVYAIDRDPDVKETADKLMQEFPGRIEFIQGCFGDMASLLKGVGVDKVDGIVLDVGVSSMQIDRAERGFSFMRDGDLDMRMGKSGMSAADFVNTAKEEEIADVIYQYGGERKSRRVAAAIVRARAVELIKTTLQLANIVRSVVHKAKDQIDPATRTFQAIRIRVNDEIGELQRALDGAEKILAKGGRLVVVSFHSLEDAVVKDFINDKSGKSEGISRHLPQIDNKKDVSFGILSRKAVKPSDEEIRENVRARSAKLRAAVKIL